MHDFVLGFSAFSGIGTIRFEKLVQHFGSPENAWKADVTEIQKVIGELTGKQFGEFREKFDLKKYVVEIEQKGIHYFIPTDSQYPFLLKKLDHPPFILFAKGNVQLLLDDRTIGIVGTRKVTDYGREVTEMFARELVENNFTIVSGMALGVDGIAHKETIKNNGRTIAVLGSGVDVPTPCEHYGLYSSLLENDGLIVSTFSPGEDASKGSFPARNAIVAGLSQGILVTEGAADSGSLITADYARKFDRKLFAVPGQITSTLSKGTNNLIKNGAIGVSSTQEIFDTLGIMVTQKVQRDSSKEATPEENIVLHLLENGPLHFDEIVRYSGKDSSTIGSLLSLMELKGLVKSLNEGEYSIN